jgi:hypothetical protein
LISQTEYVFCLVSLRKAAAVMWTAARAMDCSLIERDEARVCTCEETPMAKVGFQRMNAAQRARIAQVAGQMFSDGMTASSVCERYKIPLTTLKHICREHGINVPRQRQ